MHDDRNIKDYNLRHRYNDSMRIHLLGACAVAVLAACMPLEPPPSGSALYVFRFDEPAFVELGTDLQPVGEVPFAVPAGCGLGSVFPAPRGPLLAVELNCAFGPVVLRLDVVTAEVEQLITTSDSHFLAWAPAGDAVYLRIDSINRPRVVRRRMKGGEEALPISELTYDLSPAPSGGAFLFAFSRGMGLGSELWTARAGGAEAEQLVVDPTSYLSLARWSPDGEQIAFIKVPDSATPFTIGELWVMEADGAQARRLAGVDAGHGFPPAWSPDASQIAFVVRENADELAADTSATALLSNVYLVQVADGAMERLTDLARARVESPAWRPAGDAIAFAAVVDDRIAVYLKDMVTGDLQRVPIDSACCAAWLQR